MSSPVTALTGMFMLMWAWLGFNCGSTFRISPNYWKISALVAVTTLNGGIGGGLLGLFLSMMIKRGKVSVDFVINSTLGGLVSVTGGCSVYSPVEAVLIGAIGGMVAIGASEVLEFVQIDDPVGAVPVHFFSALWGTLAIGLFAEDNMLQFTRGLNGVFHNGGFRLLGVNALAAVVVIGWASSMTFLMLYVLDKIMGIRVSPEEEELGADYCEHGIQQQDLATKFDEIFKGINKHDGIALIQLLIKLLDEVKEAQSQEQFRPFSHSRRSTIGPMTISRGNIVDAINQLTLIRHVGDRENSYSGKQNGQASKIHPLSAAPLEVSQTSYATSIDSNKEIHPIGRVPSMNGLNEVLAERHYVPPVQTNDGTFSDSCSVATGRMANCIGRSRLSPPSEGANTTTFRRKSRSRSQHNDMPVHDELRID